MQQNFFDSLDEAYRLASITPQQTLDQIVLIGGQALILWMDVFNINEFTEDKLAFLASDDIDFLGTIQQVKECAVFWHGVPKIPSQDDMTPNSGVVIIEESDDGSMRVVDFLHQAYGIRNDHVRLYSDLVSLSNGQMLSVMSPAVCLVSRIRNLSGYLRGAPKKIKDREVSRIHSAITIVRYYLLNQIEEIKSNSGTDIKPLKRMINYLISEVLARRETRQLAQDHDFDFGQMFPNQISDVSPEMWSNHIFRSMEKFNSNVNRLRRAKATRENQKLAKLQRLKRISE